MSSEEIDELNDTIELLALDKEQLMLDKELLEEKCQELQAALDAALASAASASLSSPARNSAVSVKESAEYRALAADNDKYKDALIRLAETSNAYKEQVKTQSARISELETLVNELQAYKASAEEQLEELRQSVDSLSAFEALIERLTSENLDLVARQSEYKQTIAELEDAAELNDQLDHQQRQQIDEDKRAIESLQISLSLQERRVQEKDALAQEYVRKLEQVKELYAQSRREAERLSLCLSSESESLKESESKLAETAALRNAHDALSQEVASLRTLCSSHWQQRMRASVLYAHADRIFGGHAVYLEESKIFNTEILAISTTSLGLEANRGLAELLQLLLQSLPANDAENEREPHPLLRSLFTPLRSLAALSLALQSALTDRALRYCGRAAPQSERETLSVSLCLSARSLFESVQTLQLRVQRDLQQFLRCLQGERKGEGEEERLLSFNAAFFEHAAQLDALSLSAQAALRSLCADDAEDDESEKKRESPKTVALGESLRLFAQSARDSLSPSPSAGGAAQVALAAEAALLLLSLLVESALSGVPLPLSPSRSLSLEALRSAKVEVDALLRVARRVSAAQAALPLLDALSSLSLSLDAEGETESDATDALRSRVLAPLRRVSSSLAQTESETESAVTAVAQGPPALRFFPALLSSSALVRGRDAAALDAQHQALQDKLWALLLQGANDLLPGGAAAQLAWKARALELRRVVSERLASSSRELDESDAASQRVLSPATPSLSSSAPFAAPAGAGEVAGAARAQLQQLLHELEVKKDELRAATNKCVELQRGLDQQLTDNEKSEAAALEVDKLRTEINTLEGALAALESRSDQLARENKALKQQLVSLGGAAEGGSAKEKERESAPAAPVASSRRRGPADTSSSSAALSLSAATSAKAKSSGSSVEKDLLSLLGAAPPQPPQSSSSRRGAATPATATTPSLAASLSANDKLRSLSEEALFWRHFATKRLAASLLLLPSLSLLQDCGECHTALAAENAVEISVNSVTGDARRDFHAGYLQTRKDRARLARVRALGDAPEPAKALKTWRATQYRGSALAMKIICLTTAQ